MPHLPRYARMLTYRVVGGGKEGWHERLGSGRLVSVLLLGECRKILMVVWTTRGNSITLRPESFLTDMGSL